MLKGVEVLKTVAPEFAGTPRGGEIQRFIADPSCKNYAPEFSAKLKSGGEINLDTLKGKVVLLDFWGTWCAPCPVALPQLKRLAATLHPATLQSSASMKAIPGRRGKNSFKRMG
jgi:thiol-disulfide isomerase/thioredoxin